MSTSDPRWDAVDEFAVARLIGSDPATERAIAGNVAAGLPAIDVSPAQGKFLSLVARMIGARRILEVGTLGGVSTIWLARALPSDGVLISLEIDAHYASAARGNVAAAGLEDRVDIRVGPAATTLDALAAAGDVFDLVFIDADKRSNAVYAEMALRMSRPGTVILVDNVVRDGAVLDTSGSDPNVEGTRRLFDLAGSDPRLDATVLQTVGVKGWDGLFIGVVVDP
jgi:predicted O-methyltransferase YrrM